MGYTTGGATASPPAPERVVAYLRAAVQAESEAAVTLSPGSRSVAFVETGRAPFGGTPVVVPATGPLATWAARTRTLGTNEILWAGWPVVRGTRHGGARPAEVLAPLLFTEIALHHSDDHDELVAVSSAVELAEGGLDLVGVPSDERRGLLAAFAQALEAARTNPLDAAVGFLRGHGLVPERWHPLRLGSGGDDGPVRDAAVVWVGEPDRSVMTKALLADLEALEQRGDLLRSGPLGVVLSSLDAGTWVTDVAPRPTPAVLPTTLAQERVINAALASTLTVVTGPPGTGKSQVLANTVAAAIDRGERVLLASKNNHAIDVVHQRLSAMHPDAVPLRAGATRWRAEVARTIGDALNRKREPTSGLDEARATWQRVLSAVGEPYRWYGERLALEARVARAHDRAAAARDVLPPDLRPARPELPLADAGDLAEPALLATAIDAARRHHHEFASCPTRWFWQRRRARRLEAERDRSLRTVGALLGEPVVAAWTTYIANDGVGAALDLATAVLAVFNADAEVARAEHALAYTTVPTLQEIDDAISASFPERAGAAAALFGAHWRELLRPRRRGRGAARNYQSALAAAAGGGSIAPLRSSVRDVLDLFPVWSLTSLTVGAWFPLEGGLFDLVIVDEASQSDLASALPLLARARRALVIGDPNQLTHITGLSAAADARLASQAGLDEDLHARVAYRQVSLFAASAAASRGEPILLDRHFRSHPDVIGFSNERFYGGRLRIETDPSVFLPGPAMRWRDVPGRFERGPGDRSARNRPEAEAVLDELAAVLDELAGTTRTVGVVTPFAAQRDLLRELVADRFTGHTITVDTAHGFQGDERDVMLVSLVVADGAPEHLVRFAADPNLLNVTLTRARARTVVVGDRSFIAATGGLLAELADDVADLVG